MPKINLPLRVKCWRCEDGEGLIKYDTGEKQQMPCSVCGEGTTERTVWGFEDCDCDDGKRYDLAELYAAVEAIDPTPGSIKLPEEGEPDYMGMITLLGNEDHEDMEVEVRGASHEEAMVNAIAEWNKKYA